MIFGIDNGQDMTMQHVKDCRDQKGQLHEQCIEEALSKESEEMAARRRIYFSVLLWGTFGLTFFRQVKCSCGFLLISPAL